MKTYSRVYAKINLDAICHNMEAMHAKLKEGTKMFAVIKTDGYGHGAIEIANTIESLDYLFGFCVATVEEGLILRRHGVKKPILILGYTFEDQYEDIILNDLRPAVFTMEMAKSFSDIATSLNHDVKIHIKIDTGMSRIGLQVREENAKLIAQIAALPHIIVEGIFTHFAKADEYDKTSANHQIELFKHMIELTEREGVTIPYKHCSNSAGIVEIPAANMDIVRAGITLYGLWPSDEVDKSKIDLAPALELKSKISYVKTLEAGRQISYGGTYTTTKEERIATIPVGYGDGYPRSLSNKGYVLIHGKKAPICGRVCMDQFMVNVTDIPEVKTGDEVTLLGRDGSERITAEELGDLSKRFNYEFVCDLGKRIPRVFVKNGKIVSTRDYFSE
ncbi:MAG: alanine racemase [Lachnospiraceae bacterium]|uniref:alanine racemase n=1 Tax=Roseburia hominis TaxID=301301 RepID=UPI001F20C7D5|nr:alanine racemase [Roseburia hominis]MCI5712406.1 alanine racemase [Lachnospiraceae bacterium]MDD6169613.1 alanine racemase [Lachnospiraceae bacterium]MDY4838670.1 alanine racemase [Lachnospiraceae bacterium]